MGTKAKWLVTIEATVHKTVKTSFADSHCEHREDAMQSAIDVFVEREGDGRASNVSIERIVIEPNK